MNDVPKRQKLISFSQTIMLCWGMITGFCMVFLLPLVNARAEIGDRMERLHQNSLLHSVQANKLQKKKERTELQETNSTKDVLILQQFKRLERDITPYIESSSKHIKVVLLKGVILVERLLRTKLYLLILLQIPL